MQKKNHHNRSETELAYLETVLSVCLPFAALSYQAFVYLKAKYHKAILRPSL